MSGARRSQRWLIGLCAAALLVVAPGAARAPSAAGIEDLTQRLEALRPQHAMAYFELAEEVADVADDEDMRALARRLFGLAGVLDAEHLGRSACLALADMEENELARRRLLALAALLGGGGLAQAAPAEAVAGGGEAPSRTAVLAVTEAFSLYRRGRGSQAMTVLDKPGAMELLRALDPQLPGGANRFLEDCRHYRGQLRPSLSEGDLTRMLRLEIALLAGIERPWSSELLLGRGRPLVEVDPDRLEEALGVNAARSIYRNGRWVPAGD
jgi:hypothetical protein